MSPSLWLLLCAKIDLDFFLFSWWKKIGFLSLLALFLEVTQFSQMKTFFSYLVLEKKASKCLFSEQLEIESSPKFLSGKGKNWLKKCLVSSQFSNQEIQSLTFCFRRIENIHEEETFFSIFRPIFSLKNGKNKFIIEGSALIVSRWEGRYVRGAIRGCLRERKVNTKQRLLKPPQKSINKLRGNHTIQIVLTPNQTADTLNSLPFWPS